MVPKGERTEVREGAVDTAKVVANYFLQRGLREGVPIDQLKLQKLVYYAHAWHLANKLGPLYPDDIEAWPHGPGVRDLYVEFCDHGRRPITRMAFDFDGTQPSLSDEDRDTREFLDEVWETYKGVSGIALSNSTHAPGEPWDIIRTRYGDLDRKPRIPNELIAGVFARKIESAA